MNTKTVYQIAADGVYVGPAIAYESPLEPGVFPLPAGCVEEAPPDMGEGQAAIWSDGAWRLTADHRGETWFLGSDPVVIDFLGDPASRGYSQSPPAPSVDELRAAAKAKVDADAETYRLTFITGGAGQAMAYQQKLEEAQAYIANQSLTAVECPHIFAEIGITGETAEAVAHVVIGMHSAWQVKSADIEHKRLAAKAAIDAAETAEAVAEAEKVVWGD